MWDFIGFFSDDYLRRNIFYEYIFRSIYAVEGKERVVDTKGVVEVLFTYKVPNAVRRDRVPEVSLRFVNPFHQRSCVLPDCNRVVRCQEGYIRRHDCEQNTPSSAHHWTGCSRSRKNFLPSGGIFSGGVSTNTLQKEIIVWRSKRVISCNSVFSEFERPTIWAPALI